MSEVGNRMLYKHPGIHQIHGDNFDYIIVEDTEEAVTEAFNAGWSLTTTDALELANGKPEVKKAAEKPKATASKAAGWGSKSDDVGI